jgi:Flp pilus assembly pilin Flp
MPQNSPVSSSPANDGWRGEFRIRQDMLPMLAGRLLAGGRPMYIAVLRLFRCTAGATAIEYAFVGLLVSIAGIVGMRAIGTALSSIFASITPHL